MEIISNKGCGRMECHMCKLNKELSIIVRFERK